MEKVLVEVSKDQEGSVTKTQTVLRVVRRTSGCGKVSENFDEIITEKREEHVEVAVDKHCKEKGFSIQRAWCCLMNRRTS